MCKMFFVPVFFYFLYNMEVISVSLRRCFVYFSMARLRSGVVSNAANEPSAVKPIVGDKRHFLVQKSTIL